MESNYGYFYQFAPKSIFFIKKRVDHMLFDQ